MTKDQMARMWGKMWIYVFMYSIEPINSKGEEYLKLACPNLELNRIGFPVNGPYFDDNKNNKEVVISKIQEEIVSLFTDRGRHDLNVEINANMASKIYSGTIKSMVEMYKEDKKHGTFIVYSNKRLGIQVTGKFGSYL